MTRGTPASTRRRASKQFRANGTVDPSTVFRWLTKGMRTADGLVVKLEAVRVGGRWLTSRGAVSRFVATLTAAADPTSAATTPTPRTPAARNRASEKAAESLKRMGA